MAIAPPDEPRPDDPAPLSRRRFLRLAGLGALGAGAAGLGVRSILDSDGGDVTAAGSTSTTRRASTTTSSTDATSTTTGTTSSTTTTSRSKPSSTTTRREEPSTTSTTEAPTTTTTEPPGPDPNVPSAGAVVFGDFGGGPAQLAVAQAMTRWAVGHKVDALVTTGDNVYDFGEPKFFAAHLDAPYAELRAAGRPMWAALGNHDTVSGHGPAQLAHLGLPNLPYVKELPGVRFLVMDTNGVFQGLAEQAAWLEAEILRPGAQGTPIPVFHAPIRSCGLHGGYQPLIDLWAPIIERHRLPLVFSGHDHIYNRFLSGAGVTYIVTGGGGRDLYAHTAGCGGPELQSSHVKHHFVGLEVFPGRLVVTAVDPADAVLDRLEIPVPARTPALARR